jgi:hypothetical protein
MKSALLEEVSELTVKMGSQTSNETRRFIAKDMSDGDFIPRKRYSSSGTRLLLCLNAILWSFSSRCSLPR